VGSEVGVVLFDGLLVLLAEGTGIGTAVLCSTGKLLEAPFEDCVAFPLGADAGAVTYIVALPCGEVTVRVPQFGQKCATDISKEVLQFLQFNESQELLCAAW